MTGIGADRIVQCILGALQNTADQILAYGQAVRTGAGRDGETEIAVITPYKISEIQEERLSTAVADFNRRHDRKFSVIDIDAAAFEEKQEEIPLYREIRETGIRIWARGGD